VEPRLLIDVGGDHRLSRRQRDALGGVVGCLDRHFADDARLPADACAHQQGLAVGLQFHDFGEVGAQGLSH